MTKPIAVGEQDELIAQVAPTLRRNVVQRTIHSLAESDGYGTRSKLKALLAESG